MKRLAAALVLTLALGCALPAQAETVDVKKAMEDRFTIYAGLPATKTVAELQRWARVEIARLGLVSVDAIRAKLLGDDEIENQGGAA